MFSLWVVFEHKSEPIKIIDVGGMMLDEKPPGY